MFGFKSQLFDIVVYYYFGLSNGDIVTTHVHIRVRVIIYVVINYLSPSLYRRKSIVTISCARSGGAFIILVWHEVWVRVYIFWHGVFFFTFRDVLSYIVVYYYFGLSNRYIVNTHVHIHVRVIIDLVINYLSPVSIAVKASLQSAVLEAVAYS